jgi:hypothetical protein
MMHRRIARMNRAISRIYCYLNDSFKNIELDSGMLYFTVFTIISVLLESSAENMTVLQGVIMPFIIFTSYRKKA